MPCAGWGGSKFGDRASLEKGEGIIGLDNSTLMAMVVRYNWFFLWDCTFRKSRYVLVVL